MDVNQSDDEELKRRKNQSFSTPPRKSAIIPVTQLKKKSRRRRSSDNYGSPMSPMTRTQVPDQACQISNTYEEETDNYENFDPMPPPKTKIDRPIKTCMKKNVYRKTPISSYISEISPGVHEIIIDGLSGPFYIILLKDSIEAYEFLFYKQGCSLMDDGKALKNKLIGNMQMTRNMFRKDLDLWIACILFHPQMGRAHFELLYFLKHKSNMWLNEYRQRYLPIYTMETFRSYSEFSDTIGGTPTNTFKRNSWLIYVATVIILAIHSVFIEFCDPNVFREFLMNLGDSVLAESDL